MQRHAPGVAVVGGVALAQLVSTLLEAGLSEKYDASLLDLHTAGR